MNFSTVREFNDFIWINLMCFRGKKSVKSQNINAYKRHLYKLYGFLEEMNNTPYEFVSEDSLNDLYINLCDFFNSRFELYTFLFKSIPSYEILCRLLDPIYEEVNFDQNIKIIGYDKNSYCLFIENLEIFINGILNFPSKVWKKKESIFEQIINSIFKLIIKVKFYKILFFIKFSDYEFSKDFIKKIFFFIIFFIIFNLLSFLNLIWLFWIIFFHFFLGKKIKEIIFSSKKKDFFYNQER
jgi:hypothetical protein